MPAAGEALARPSVAPSGMGLGTALWVSACLHLQGHWSGLPAYKQQRAARAAPPPPPSPARLLQPSGSGYGENLAASTAYRTCAAAVPLWLGGRSSYTAGAAGAPPQSALSWTQVVWKVGAHWSGGSVTYPGMQPGPHATAVP